MKKILYTLAILGCLAFTFGSCEGPDGPMGPPGYDGFDGLDGLQTARVIEFQDIDFQYDAKEGFIIHRGLNPMAKIDDVVLVYRLSGLIDDYTPIWQLIPRTIYVHDNNGVIQGEFDYDYDFSREDFTIYAGGPVDFNSPLVEPFITRQTFRIVIIPGIITRNIDVSDYTTVINLLNIDQNNIQTIEVNK